MDMKIWGVEVYPDAFAKEVKSVFDAFIAEGYTFDDTVEKILKSNLKVENNSTAVLSLVCLEIIYTNHLHLLKEKAMKALIHELYKAHLIGAFNERKKDLIKFNQFIK
jgi:hypothetical protein